MKRQLFYSCPSNYFLPSLHFHSRIILRNISPVFCLLLQCRQIVYVTSLSTSPIISSSPQPSSVYVVSTSTSVFISDLQSFFQSIFLAFFATEIFICFRWRNIVSFFLHIWFYKARDVVTLYPPQQSYLLFIGHLLHLFIHIHSKLYFG